MVLNTCNVFLMAVSVLPLERRIIVPRLERKLRLPHFTNGRPQLSTSSKLVYVAAYYTLFETSDEA